MTTSSRSIFRTVADYFRDTAITVRTDITVLTLLFAIPFFQFLGHIPLIDPDEGRYAEIPREMLERSDFVTPLLNYVKYFEKPPLHYWLNAASFTLFGQNEFAARFPGALCGLLTVLITYYVGRKVLSRQEGLAAALILGTSAGFIVQSRIDITDMTLTFCMTGCIGFFLLASRKGETRATGYYYLFYIFSALAVLAKGLIGFVLPGGVIFVYLLCSRRWRLLREMRLCSGLLLFMAVAAPWFVLVSLRNPEFARFFFIHEHFERFLTKVHGRYQPMWFFIPVLAGTMLPWSFFIPAAVQRWWQERRGAGADERLYLLVWAVLIFAFFSKSSSKLVPYILPVFPPLALLISGAFRNEDERLFKPLRISGWALTVVLAILGAGIIVYPHVARRPDVTIAGSIVTGAVFLAGAILAGRGTARMSALHLLLGLVLFGYVLEIAAPPFFLEGVAEKKSHKKLSSLINEKAGGDAIIASYGVRQGVSFYTGRRVVVVGDLNELEFGSRQGDQTAWFVDIPRFVRLWEGEKPVMAILTDPERADLEKRTAVPVHELGKQGKHILVTNR